MNTVLSLISPFAGSMSQAFHSLLPAFCMHLTCIPFLLLVMFVLVYGEMCSFLPLPRPIFSGASGATPAGGTLLPY